MKKAAISIEPYFDADVPNMGFERYGLNTAPGSETTEYISKDVNGRYMTGLDIHAPSVVYLEDEEEKAAKIKEIEATVSRLESVFGVGALDARNAQFWNDFTIKLGYSGKSIDPQSPRDELAYHAVKSGGFSAIAPSLEKAREGDYKFYLRQMEQDSELKIQRSLQLKRAGSELIQMYENDQHKMYLVAKVVLNPNSEFTPTTPKGIIYEKLEQFIEGTIVKDNKKATVKQFVDACKMTKESLYVQGLIRDALYYSVVQKEPDGYIYNRETETRLGKNEKDAVKFIENPSHQSELENLKTRVEAKLSN